MDGFAILDYIDFYFGTRIFFISLFHRIIKEYSYLYSQLRIFQFYRFPRKRVILIMDET